MDNKQWRTGGGNRQKITMISVLIVCRQIDEYLLQTVKSVEALEPQILIDISDSGEALGIRKNRLVNQAAYDWVLVLDTDEVASTRLREEIKEVLKHGQKDIHGYNIPYQNYIFGKPVHYGGEKYSRTQFFRKQYGSFTPAYIHEHPIIGGQIEKLTGIIHHYSYVTLPSVLVKFTKYAWQMAEEKRKVHEEVTVKKLFLYGPHMVWARVIKDEGWRDGWRGVVIALCFGYMESLIYWFLLLRNIVAY